MRIYKAKKEQEKKDSKILKARAALKTRIDAKTTVALQSLVEKMAQPRAAQLPDFMTQQVKATMLKLQETIDTCATASKDVKLTMPETQDLGWTHKGQRSALGSCKGQRSALCSPSFQGPALCAVLPFL